MFIIDYGQSAISAHTATQKLKIERIKIIMKFRNLKITAVVLAILLVAGVTTAFAANSLPVLADNSRSVTLTNGFKIFGIDGNEITFEHEDAELTAIFIMPNETDPFDNIPNIPLPTYTDEEEA